MKTPERAQDVWPVLRGFVYESNGLNTRVWTDWRVGNGIPYADFDYCEYYDDIHQASEIHGFFGRDSLLTRADAAVELARKKQQEYEECKRNRMSFVVQDP